MTRLSQLRRHSSALAGLPALSQAQLADRWQLHRDTVRGVLAAHMTPAAPGPSKRPRFSIVEAWRIEGVSHEAMHDLDRRQALMDPLLTANDLAIALDCVPATVRNYAREGLLPTVIVGRSLRFRKSDLEAKFEGIWS